MTQAQDVVWTITAPLEERSFYRDWDYFTSMLYSLKDHWHRYGIIPEWNYSLCGGKSELANPQSFAYTWPSLLAYLLEPNVAAIFLWIILSLVGWWCAAKLFESWFKQAFAAWVGATLYVFNGYFAAHFNQGHLTFAFFHLIPALLLAWDRAMSAKATGRPTRISSTAVMVLLSFLFFTAALPHPLFYFYPAFLAYLPFSYWQAYRKHGYAMASRSFALTACEHSLGILLASYKFLPIVAYQRKFPRRGVLTENLSLRDVAADSLRFVTEFWDLNAPHVFSAQKWGLWEYHAYVGLVPWLLAGGTLLTIVWHWRQPGRWPRFSASRLHIAFGVLLLALGMNLSLGNGNPLSLSASFRHLPLLGGIRVFGRFQILMIFGLAILAVAALGQISKISAKRRGLRWILAGLTLGPLLTQSAFLIWNIGGESYADLGRIYPASLSSHAVPLYLVQDSASVMRGYSHQTYLLRMNFWVPNCYEPLTIGKPLLSDGRVGAVNPIVTPFPQELVVTDPDTLSASYHGERPSTVDFFIAETPFASSQYGLTQHQGAWRLDTAGGGSGDPAISNHIRINDLGFLISYGALALFLIMLVCLRHPSAKPSVAGDKPPT